MTSREAPEAPANGKRFRGLNSRMREFYEALDREPCPTDWPAGDRVIYAADVLSPLKTLVQLLARELEDAAPPVGAEARVGASLSFPGGGDEPEDCPVRRIRFWDGRTSPSRSPLLYVDFSGEGLEIGLESANGDPRSSANLRRSLLEDPTGFARAEAMKLPARGWEVSGVRVQGEGVAFLPTELRSWMRNRLTVSRHLPWEMHLDDPSIVQVLGAHLRELLPVFDLLRGVETPATRAAGDR